MDILAYNFDQLERWFLMLFRISSMMLVMPVYGYTSIPATARVAIAFFVTSTLFPLHPEMQLNLGPGVINFLAIVLREVLIGLSIGLSTVFLFFGVRFAGHVMGHTMGFSMIQAVDPFSQERDNILGQLLSMFTLLLFFLFEGHHFLLMAIDESFVRIPIGTGGLTARAVEGFAVLSADIFSVGIQLGAPVLVTVLVAEVALGMVARTVPQMNVWIIGFPLKIAIGLFTLALTTPMVVFVFEKIYRGWEGSVIDFVRSLVVGG